jgi:hypothetical protein
MKRKTNHNLFGALLLLGGLGLSLTTGSQVLGPVAEQYGAYVTPEPVSKEGVVARAAVPREWHIKNKGGSDGAGLCVYASAAHMGRMQGDPVFAGMFEWMRNFPGGSYPRKFKASVERYAREKGLPEPSWVQVERADWELLRIACESGRAVGTTYSISPTGRYGGRRIAHMVNTVHFDGQRLAILDNNFPGSYEWMTRDEAQRVGVLDWVIILLTPGVPPRPWN